MDQNNQSNQPEQPTQVPTTPAVPEQSVHNEPVSTVMQPADAQPVVLPVEPANQTVSSETAATQHVPAAQTTAPDAPQAKAPVMTIHQDQPIPTGNQSKKPMLMIVGVFIGVILIAGGAVYVMGFMGKTQRLGMYTEKSLPATMQKQAVSPTPLPEENDLNTLDVSNPDNELKGLETDLNSL